MMACFPNVTLTVIHGGRLGNQILEYASVWSMARLYGLKPFVSVDMITRLSDVFEGLSVPSTNEFMHNKTSCQFGDRQMYFDDVVINIKRINQNVSIETIVMEARKTNRIIVQSAFIVLLETIAPLASQLRVEFHYKPELLDGAQRSLLTFRDELLQDANDSRVGQVVYVGIHVRRRDYRYHLRSMYNAKVGAGVGYYRHAVHWMRNTLRVENEPVLLNIAFVVSSDDPIWCKEVLIPALKGDDFYGKKQEPNLSDNLGTFNVFWGGQGDVRTPEQDMVLLSSCNHSIVSYGTYGLWSALMAGGKAVAYDISASEGYRHDRGYTPTMMFAERIDNWLIMS